MFIDWLEFTYKVEPKEDLGVYEQFLIDFPMFENLLDHCVLAERGMYGYTHVLRYCDEYMIMYNPKDQKRMGVHVVFPGHGMWRMCELFGLSGDDKPDFVDVKPIFQYITEHNGKLTRCDISFDDFTKTYKPIHYERWNCFGRIRSNCSTNKHDSSAQQKGDTYYLGRRGRARYFRVYDKAYESDGAIDAIRYEFELKEDYLDMIVNKVLNGEHFDFADLIFDLFVVTEEYELSDNENVDRMRKHRAGVLQEWVDFVNREMRPNSSLKLSSDPDLTVSRVKKEPSFRRTYRWVTKQLLKTLYIFGEAYGFDRLENIIRRERNKLKPLELNMLEKFREEVPVFFMSEDEQD